MSLLKSIGSYDNSKLISNVRAMTPIGFRERHNLTPMRSNTPVGSYTPKRPSTPINMQFYTAEMNYQSNYKCTSPGFADLVSEVNRFNMRPITAAACEKLESEEVRGINQLGAMEMICVQFRNARTRMKTVGLVSIVMYYKQILEFDNQRIRYIEQIDELRDDKFSLLEDNAALRKHNEALIDNLEKSNFSFQALNLHLDKMKICRMGMIIMKMVEPTLLETFLFIKSRRNY